MRTLIFTLGLILYLLNCNHLQGQCVYLAYDGFSDSLAALEAYSGGSGWQQPWMVQNNNAVLPGYQSNAGSLAYLDLQSTSNKVQGGRAYLMAGRRFNTSDNGPFAAFVQNSSNDIGSVLGDTLWCSFLLQKLNNNDQEVFVELHNSAIPWCSACANNRIGFGYYGSGFHDQGQRRWHLRINDSFYNTGFEPLVGSTNLVVLRIIFLNGSTQVAVYLNPSDLGNDLPLVPTLTANATAGLVFRSIAMFLGNSPGNANIDEIRLADQYACVTPDAAVSVNLPPVANLNLSSLLAIVPASINFSGLGSYDPEGQNLLYTWNFGDGSSPFQSTQTSVSHLYTVVGEIPVSLTVSDSSGLQHTTYQTLTLLNQDSSFPCQTTLTPLSSLDCSGNLASFRVNSSHSFLLHDSGNQIMAVSNGAEYHNLSAGVYQLSVQGNNNCRDSFDVHIQVDSSLCAGYIAPSCAMDIGTNLSGFSDWSVERPMKNLFKHIRNEVIGYAANCFCWNSNVGAELSLDAAGYPTHAPQQTSVGSTYVRYIISADGGNLRADSSYVLLYDGVGTVQLNGNMQITATSPGRIAFTALDNNNMALSIVYSDSNNHLRNIRLVRPQHEFVDTDADPFYEAFKNKIAPFKLLRFMDWQNTNGSPNSSWSARASTQHFTYAGEHGMPYEVIIKLANETGKDIWLCVPHQADSAYVANMASLFRDSLRSDVVVYLEYSNEVWNWIFPQAHFNDTNRPANLNYGRAMANKAGKVFSIWHNIWAAQACRVKRVLGLQVGFNSLNEQILSELKQSDWDFAAPTHYFGLDHSANGVPNLNILGANANVQDIINNAQNSWNAFRPAVRQDYNLVKLFGKKIVTYEGGQHFVGNSFGIPYPYQQAMWDAQQSPLMYNLYKSMHDSIRSWGCKLATNFSLASAQESVYGSWGILADIDQQGPFLTSAPKYQAVIENASSEDCRNTRRWLGNYSNLWSDLCNWEMSRLPDAFSHVIIPAVAPNMPQVDINSTIRSLRVESNAQIQVNSSVELEIVEQ